jgi:polyhydroxyalkanoate synthesis regulator protein
MDKSKHQITIKRYVNRRLYHTGTGTYVTADQVAARAQDGEDVVVHDAATGEDITDLILAQHRLH